jgi:hypothetical protein
MGEDGIGHARDRHWPCACNRHVGQPHRDRRLGRRNCAAWMKGGACRGPSASRSLTINDAPGRPPHDFLSEASEPVIW